MNNQEAKQIVMGAIKFGGNTANAQSQVKNAVNWIGNIKGWEKKDIFLEFVNYAIVEFEKWRKTDHGKTGLIIKDSNDLNEVVWRYCDLVVIKEIEENM